MIEARGLIKSFENVTALDGLNLHVNRGNIYGLVGPNGAGKSTFIRHLTGIYRQDGGELKVLGEDVFENNNIKSKIASIPDEISYFPTATIEDMMKFYKSIYPTFDKERFDKLGSAFELAPNMTMRKLSKGMQKQAAFWIAMSMRPEILVLDEPVDGLDPVMRRQVWSVLMSDVAEYGTTVLVSSHNLRELEDVCDRVGIMNKGKMLIERSLAELQENIVKVQYAMPDGEELPENIGLNVIHKSTVGRVSTIIVRGDAEGTLNKLSGCHTLFADVLPLTLEEIFIYELGGENYAVKEIIL